MRTTQSANLLFNVLLISSVGIFLSGCSLFTDSVEPIEVQSEPVEREPLDLDPPQSLKLPSVNWVVVTKDNAEEVLSQLEESGQKPVIFGMTSSGYENLSISFAEIRNHINTQREIILQYQQYYEGSDESDDTTSDE